LVETAMTAGMPEAATFGIAFNSVNERAVRWAETHAAQAITGIRSTSRKSVQGAVVEAMRAGTGIRELTPQIADALSDHISNLTGLTTGHAKAVDRLFRSFDLDDPAQLAQALKVSGRKAAKLLRWRAETIARTETIRAANQGQQLVWDEAVDEGLLPTGTKKVWLATGDNRTCRICAVLDGQVVAIGGEFSINVQATSFTRQGDNFTVAGTKPLPHPTTDRTPPAHPRCRCSIILEDVAM
jgi:hypothetical protein